MERRVPRPGEIYIHFKDKLYQIITIALDSETREPVVVYQALYEDFKTYVRTLTMFMSEVDHVKYPDVKQKYRFELRNQRENEYISVAGPAKHEQLKQEQSEPKEAVQKETVNKETVNKETVHKEDIMVQTPGGSVSKEEVIAQTDGEVNLLLMKFLDAVSYSKKLEVITSNRRHLNDRLINDMAVALDLAVDEGPLDERITGLINCLQAMCRFEDRRLR